MHPLRFLTAALLLLVLTPISTARAQGSAPAFDASRAAANTLRRDAMAQPAISDQRLQPTSTLMDENAFAPATPGDSDIGQQLILKRNEKDKDFGVYLDSAYFFTDNAAQVHSGAKQDWFYVGGVTLDWQPRIAGRFYFDSFVSQHWYRYDKYNALDYEAGEASAGVIALMPELWNTVWHVHYYYERITQGLDNTPGYETHNLRAGVQKSVLFDRKNSLNAGLLASLALDSTPEQLRRNEYSATLAWNYKITHSLVLTTSYRLLCYDYSNLDGRHDWDHNFGVGLVYRWKEWLELAGSWNYTINRSNQDQFSYNTQLAGPSLALKAKF